MMDYEFQIWQESDLSDPDYKAAQEEFIAGRPDGLFGSAIDPDRPRPPLTDRWSVSLPHQCDEWTISEYEDHATTVAALEDFIEQAQVALARLKERNPT